MAIPGRLFYTRCVKNTSQSPTHLRMGFIAETVYTLATIGRCGGGGGSVPAGIVGDILTNFAFTCQIVGSGRGGWESRVWLGPGLLCWRLAGRGGELVVLRHRRALVCVGEFGSPEHGECDTVSTLVVCLCRL